MANRKETKRIINLVNTIINNPKFLSDLASLTNNNYNGVLFALGDVLEYYITSRDNRVLTAEEMNVVVGLFKYIGQNKDYRIFNMEDGTDPLKALKRNIYKDGYLTRSTNPYFLKRISRYGLGNQKTIDKSLNESFEFLESVFGTNQYSINDELVDNQFCMSTPGANSFYQAGSNSPKRLFLGILGQSEEELLPLLVGESKLSYFRRVLDKKVSLLVTDKKIKKRALKCGKKLIKKLCRDKSIIMLIPTYSDYYSLKVTTEKDNDYNVMPIGDFIYFKIMDNSPLTFFSRDFGEANQELGNIISFNTIIPSKELGILEVPDRYEIMQIIAKNKGYKKNTKFSYLTGEIIQEKIISS